jgi:peptidoglycan/xylan/chitin deacetylase (PgdA/CDA1 family)
VIEGRKHAAKRGMVINLLKNNFVPAFCARVPFSALQRLTGVIPLIPYYHGVSDDEVPHVKHLYQFKNVKQFRKDLETFLKYYQVIDLRDLVSNLRTGRPLPKNSLLLQFDDGFREVYDVVAPILWEKGVTATFFLISAFLDNMGMAYSNKASLLIERLTEHGANAYDKQLSKILADWKISGTSVTTALLSVDYAKKDVLDVIASVLEYDFTAYILKSRPYLTSEQVHKLIGMGFTIGAHSVDHPKYSQIPLQEQLHQTRMSIRFLRERFSLDYDAFAYPNGDDNLSDQFFRQIFEGGYVDASFGNVGLTRHVHPRHFSRFPMEKQSLPAEKIIGRYYAKGLYDLIKSGRLMDRKKPACDSVPNAGN